MTYDGEWAVKFPLQTISRYGIPDLVRLTQLVHTEGFSQVWVNDNLCQRNIFVVMAALAARVPIKLGTSIIAPYFRNPVDIADSLAALSELTQGRELSVGIAKGDVAHAGLQIEMPHPIAMVRQTTLALKALLNGETITFRDYPVPAAYHRIRPQREFRLAFSPAAPVRFYGGGNGPKTLKIAGEIMDGALIGNHYIPLVRSGRLDRLLTIERNAVNTTQPGKALFDIGELDISIARDRQRAIRFAKPFAARILLDLETMAFNDDEFRTLGIAPGLIISLKKACAGGATLAAAAELLPDHAVQSCVVAGSAEECREQLYPLIEEAARLKLGQISLAKLGPDSDEAIKLLRHDVLPV